MNRGSIVIFYVGIRLSFSSMAGALGWSSTTVAARNGEGDDVVETFFTAGFPK
jgi:hypothetical protein